MSNTPQTTASLRDAEGPKGAFQPLDPFRSLRVHFGMLLGVDDFEALDAYHRGKMWLHSSWLHREGAVWGLEVQPDIENGEIRVLPGLALDALGRELHLEADACLNVAKWYEKHKDDPELQDAVQEVNGGVRFDAHVTIAFRPCLTRQVPAISEPCEDSGASTAYSRVFEAVELKLVPGLAPEPTRPYHRLRLLFSLEDPILDEGSPIPSDQEVLDARDAILALPAEDQPKACLEAFRDFAASDEMDLGPASGPEGEGLSLFPGLPPAPLALADVQGIALGQEDDSWALQGIDEVDNRIRRSHVATSTIQELLCGPLFSALSADGEDGDGENGNGENGNGENGDGGNGVSGNGGGGDGGEELEEGPQPDDGGEADAAGPRIDPEAVELNESHVRLFVEGELEARSVKKEAFTVSVYQPEKGWSEAGIQQAFYAPTRGRITLSLTEALKSGLVRVVARGTGPTPVLGASLVPLAGAVGGPAGGPHDGNDFVYMRKYGSGLS